MDVKKLINSKLKIYQEQLSLQQAGVEAAAKQLKLDIAAGSKDAVKAASFLILQQNLKQTEGAIKALNEVLNEIK